MAPSAQRKSAEESARIMPKDCFRERYPFAKTFVRSVYELFSYSAKLWINQKFVSSCGLSGGLLGGRLHHLKLKLKLFSPADIAEVELPEFACEAQGWPALVEVRNQFQSDSTP